MRNVRLSTLLLSALLLLCGSVFAQDPGNPDSVRVTNVNTNAGQKVGVPITVYNDEDLGGYSLGFTWNSGDATIDSISYIGTRLDPSVNHQFARDNVNHRCLVGFADFSAVAPLTPGDGLVFKAWFSIAPGAPDQFITIDSAFYPPAGKFVLSPVVGSSIFPQFQGGQIKVGNPQPPPVIVLSQPSFSFNALVGGGNPVSQVENVTNGGVQPLNWTVTKSSTWLSLSPPNGTAPSVIVVAVNTTGLTAGVYIDTGVVAAVGATNSPQKFVVTLTMTIPPPYITLSPTSFYFQAQENAANPPGQNLSITNTGQGTLNWTATKNAPWLTLSSSSGTAPSSITLTVDDTGLLAGVYTDSVQISDPTATNNPQYARVTFEIFSEFPVIVPSPDSIFAVGSGTQDPYPRTLLIENNGGGVMSWHVTKTASWMNLSPDTGSATQGSPGVVTVTFDHNATDFGQHRDTILISSGNAINSPQRVPVLFWKAEVPQQMNVSPSTLSFTEVECGSYPGVQPKTFNVSATQVAPPLEWTATHSAPWLTISPTSAFNNAQVTVSVSVAGMSPGVYKDTIIVSSAVAFNPPQKVIVTFTVTATSFLKSISLTKDSLLYIYKYTQVGSTEQDVTIYNTHGGCIDWAATADVPWLQPIPDNGTTVQNVTIRANPVGLSLGRHTGNVIFTSTVASNSPKNLPVVLWVYTFGDANGDGIVDVSDVVYILNYIFSDGPTPVPVFWTGDVDCSRTIDISDAVYLLNYIFDGGAPPCLY